MTAKTEWEGKKAKFEYLGSIVGLLAASVTLSITIGGAFFKDAPEPTPQTQIVHHVVHLPYFEALATELLKKSDVMALQGSQRIDADALKSEIPDVEADAQDVDTVQAEERTPLLFGGIGLAIGVLVLSVAVLVRRPAG